MKKTDPVVYIGGATRRKITKENWEGAGIKGQDGLVWNVLNNKRCKVEDLTSEALEFLLVNHPGEFVVGEPDGGALLAAKEAQRAVDQANGTPADAAPNGN